MKKIKIVPDNNSISHTCREVLSTDYLIVDKDEDYTFDLSDKADKFELQSLFSNKYYYPRPQIGKFCIKKPVDGHSSQDITIEKYNGNGQLGYIYQGYRDGKEVTVDVLIVKGKLIDFSVRARHNIWKGISMKSIFTNEYAHLIEKILKDMLKEYENIDNALWVTQFIIDEVGVWLIENNQRPCANMCYGREGNYILNFIRAELGEKITVTNNDPKEINRYLGWTITEK